MAGSDQWEKLLDLYIHDYLIKTNSKETAEMFRIEKHVPSTPVAIDVPGGFLKKWWTASMSNPMYTSEMHEDHEAKEEASNNVMDDQMKEIKQENIFLRTQQFDFNQPSVVQFQDNKPWMNQQMPMPVDTVPAEIDQQTNLHSQMQQFMMNQQRVGDNRPWSNQKIPIYGDTMLAEIGQTNQPMVGQFQDNKPWMNQQMPIHVDTVPAEIDQQTNLDSQKQQFMLNQQRVGQQYQDIRPWMNQKIPIYGDTMLAEIGQMNQTMVGQFQDNRAWMNQQMPMPVDTVPAEIDQQTNLNSQMQQFMMNQQRVGWQFQDNRQWMNQKMPLQVDPTRAPKSAVPITRLYDQGHGIEIIRSILAPTHFQRFMALDPQLQERCIVSVLAQEMEKKQLGLGAEWIQTLRDHYLNEYAAQTQRDRKGKRKINPS